MRKMSNIISFQAEKSLNIPWFLEFFNFLIIFTLTFLSPIGYNYLIISDAIS